MADRTKNTKEKILLSAKKHFLKDGFSGASLRGIVKDAGMTTGAFYKYYPTKEALFDAFIDPYVNHVYEIYDNLAEKFGNLPIDMQLSSLREFSSIGINKLLNYIYDNYDNFKLLICCNDNEKYITFIHGLVEREEKATMEYVDRMRKDGKILPEIDNNLMHMIYSGMFSSIFQIIEHDIDVEKAKNSIEQLKKFYAGGWEKVWNINMY